VAPPFIITEREIDEIVNRLSVALEATLKGHRSSVVSRR